MRITHQDVQLALGSTNESGQWICFGVSIDTRTLKSGNLFIAIRGPNFDGHDFIKVAKERGAVAVITDREITVDIPYVIVLDTLKALQDLAGYKRSKSTAIFIGITGSVGKTTTKEMVYNTLILHGKAFRNFGNFNNHIGLPLSLLNAPDDSQYIILEMGMSNFGEIEFLAKIVRPEISIITNVGAAHLGNFNSIEEIAKAKAEIFIHTKSIVILNKEDKFYEYLLDRTNLYRNISKVISVGSKGTDVVLVSYGSGHAQVSIHDTKYEFLIPNLHLAQNSLLALSVIHALCLDMQVSIKGLNNFTPQEGRGNIITKNGITIINDTYNANPPSMKAALKSLSDFDGRKVAVIGDMLELGDKARELHEELAQTIEQYKIDVVITIGSNMKHLFDILPHYRRGNHFRIVRGADILRNVRKGDVVLIKGSRAMRMESIIERLICYDE